MGPIRPTRLHAATSLPCRLHAAPSLYRPIGRPRQPARGSELSLTVPSQHVALRVPGESNARLLPTCMHRFRLRLSLPEARPSQVLHLNPFRVGLNFGASWFAPLLQPAELLASLSGPDRVHRTQPQRLLLPSFWPSRSPSSPSYDYGGAWALPPAGLPPAGTAASFAARGIVKPPTQH
jgi:hypothetical protein